MNLATALKVSLAVGSVTFASGVSARASAIVTSSVEILPSRGEGVKPFYPHDGTETSRSWTSVLPWKSHRGREVSLDRRGSLGVDLSCGEVFVEVVDLWIRGRGLDLVFARTYRSRFGLDTELGNGWNHSYDRSVQLAPGGLMLRNGWGREDLFLQQVDGSYTRSEFFLVGLEEGDGSYKFSRPDTGYMKFRALDGSSAQGKLDRIVDRHGNAIVFAYSNDQQGVLTLITDTLGRESRLEYNAQGFLSSIIDYAGRKVEYEHYVDGDIGGSAGDLKSVTSPVVTGTPNGNDYLAGKTEVYSYTSGHPVERLNHNLLTVTRPAGAAGPEYDVAFQHIYQSGSVRVVRMTQRPNLAADLIDDFAYVASTPGPGIPLLLTGIPALLLGDTDRVVIQNDPAGNVTEYRHDVGKRPISLRRYTGRADPTQPTTLTHNRPQDKLRPDDPDYFETTIRWNPDSLPTRIKVEGGGGRRLMYDTDPSPLRRGNLLSVVTMGASGAQLEEEFEYHPTYNLITRHWDARGKATVFVRDSGTGDLVQIQHRDPSVVEDFEHNGFGQLTARVLPDNGSGHRERIEYFYNTDGTEEGYLQSVVRDATGLALTESYTHDLVGNITSVTDPKGNDTLYHVNSLGQVVRVETRAVLLNGSPVRYQRDLFYDSNDDLVRVDIQNVDDQGFVQNNSHYSTTYDYDKLSRLIEVVREIEVNSFATTVIERTATETLWRFPEATNGNDPFNTRRDEFDERGLPYRRVRAPGNPDQSTDEYAYDSLGSLVEVLSGLESEPRTTKFAYDFGRLTTSTDAMGNTWTYGYDENGNRTAARLDGELVDVVGTAGNVRLREVSLVYDCLDRLVRRDEEFFNPSTRAPIGDGIATTTLAYSDRGQVLTIVDDNGDRETRVYDTAGRLSSLVDAVGNSTTIAYDLNSNIETLTQLEKHELTGSDEIYATSFLFDGLDRVTQTFDPVGNMQEWCYDSRTNVVRYRDPEGTQTLFQWTGGSDQNVGDILGSLQLRVFANPVTLKVPGRLKWMDVSLSKILDPIALTVFTPGSVPNEGGRLGSLMLRVSIPGTETTTSGLNILELDFSLSIEPSAPVTGTVFYGTVFDGLGNRGVGSSGHDDAQRHLSIFDFYIPNSVITSTVIDLNGNGTPDPSDIETTFAWDQNTRLVTKTDDNGNMTQFEYDSLNRQTAVLFADGTRRSVQFSVHDDVVQTTDGNSTVVQIDSDALGRPLQKIITPGPGVSPETTFEVFEYDGQSRLVSAADDDSTLILRHDSLSQLVEEIQNGQQIRCAYDAVGNCLKIRYPSGRIINNTFDASHRMRTVSESGTELARMSYAGERPVLIEYSNGTRTELEYDGVANSSDDFGVRRIIRTTHSFNGSVFDDHTSRWDSNQRRVERIDVRPGGSAREDDYVFRGDNRLIEWQLTYGAGSPSTETYLLDGNGNRQAVMGGSNPGTYTMDSTLPDPGDFQVNNYTTTPFDARIYDGNGNTVSLYAGSGTQGSALYDARHLVEWFDTTTLQRHTYSYDALGRRIGKVIDADGQPQVLLYIYRGNQVIEEQAGGSVRTYAYLDGFRRPFQFVSGSAEFVLHGDVDESIIALTDENGHVVERVDYEANGTPSFFDGNLNPIAGSTVGNTVLFRGWTWNLEFELYGAVPDYDSGTGRAMSLPPVVINLVLPSGGGAGLNGAEGFYYDPRGGRTMNHPPLVIMLDVGGSGLNGISV